MWQWCTKESAPTAWESGWRCLSLAPCPGWDKPWHKRPKSLPNRCFLVSPVLDRYFINIKWSKDSVCNFKETGQRVIAFLCAIRMFGGQFFSISIKLNVIFVILSSIALYLADCPHWNVLWWLSSFLLRWWRWPWDHSGEWLHLCLRDTRAIQTRADPLQAMWYNMSISRILH